ncbi:MPN domain-containing protein [Halocalculus aciditolerans]|nr:hypothetical protein [Halocalculus aciditolerans]
MDPDSAARDRVFVARPLLDVLLEFGSDTDPQRLSVALATEDARDLVPSAASTTSDVALADLDSDQSVYAEFFLPDAGRSVENVFGVNLSTPPGRTRGRFVTHPDGNPDLAATDDLSVRVLVATPPYDVENVRAYDRSGRRIELVVVAADAPDEEPL